MSRRQSPTLQRVAAEERQILGEERALNAETATLLQLERKAITTAQASDATTKNVLTRVERNITAAVTPQPLTHITSHDLAKGAIGALIGIVLHFTFTYGVELGEHLSAARATILLGVTFLIGGALLYGTGFRNITDKTVLWLLPYRLVVLFATATIITTVTLAFFYEHLFADPSLAYRQIATVNLSAVIGACTADLIGRHN